MIIEKYSDDYKHIRSEFENWVKWKKEYYNNCFATSIHAKKLNIKNKENINE